MDSGLVSTLLSLTVIAIFLLGAGGMVLIVKRNDVKKGALMLIAALVLLGNVLVWTL